MKIEIDGTTLFFDVEGSGLGCDEGAMAEKPTLLLLHGGPGADHSMFRPYFSRFSEVSQIVYLDLRGHGRSARNNPEKWNLSTWAADVASFCKALGIAKPIIFGHSFGGMLATTLAAAYPELPGKLILAHTVAQFNLPRTLNRFERIGGEKAKEAANLFWSQPSADVLENFKEHASPVYNQSWPNDIFEVSLRAINNPEVSLKFWSGEGKDFDNRLNLSTISCETLVFGGTHDPFSGEEDINELTKNISESLVKSKVIENCGHFFWWDAPEETHDLIYEFICGEPA